MNKMKKNKIKPSTMSVQSILVHKRDFFSSWVVLYGLFVDIY